MKKNNNFKIRFGYSIVELSIVIVVISLLMSGVFSIATGSLVANKNTITSQKINSIYNSIGTFIAINKRLPCPASLSISLLDDANYGNEVITSGECSGAGVFNVGNYIYGTIPIRSLNLDSSYAIDEYGNKLNYIIDRRFAKNFIASPPIDISSTQSFGTTSASNIITIRERTENDTTIDITTDAILVIFSSGPNGFGSFATNGVQNSNATDVDELSNQYNSASPFYDNIFYLKSSNSNIFDDILIYKTRLNLINDFSLANLIACPGSAITDSSFTQVTLYYSQFLYANSTCPGFSSMIKTLRCSFGGEWQYIVRDCLVP